MPEDNVAQRTLDAMNLKRAIELRVRGAHWGEVADQCGFSSPSAALRAVGAAMASATQRAAETADMMRDTANLQLDMLLSESLKMLAEDAPVSYDQDGNELAGDDRAVKLRAIDEARRLVESKAKLNGVAAAKPKEDDKPDQGGIRIIGVAVSDLV